MRMSTLISRGLLVISLFVVLDCLPLLAQKESKTKVTIIKEYYDENGQKIVEKIIKEGAEADAIDLDKLSEGADPWSRSFEFRSFGDLENLDGLENFSPFGEGGMDQFKQFFDSLGFGNFQFFGGDEWSNIPWNQFGEEYEPLAIKPKLGVKISELESEAGILVTHVIEDTPADRAGLQEGDVILAVDDQEVSSTADLVDHIQGLQADDVVMIDLRRGDEHLRLKATLTEYKPKKELDIRKL